MQSAGGLQLVGQRLVAAEVEDDFARRRFLFGGWGRYDLQPARCEQAASEQTYQCSAGRQAPGRSRLADLD
jgi:hypothetical protein